MQGEHLRRQPANGRRAACRTHHPVALGSHQRDPRIDQFLLRIEDVERGALADARFLAHAVERDLGGLDLGLRRLDIGLGGIELAPGLHHRLPHLVARGVEIEPPLPERLLGLPDQRIFGAALIERNA